MSQLTESERILRALLDLIATGGALLHMERDGPLSAQFEHTVAVTGNGVRVLTLRAGEKALH